MPEETVIFVCEHGAVKSVLAAAYFNKFAEKSGLNVHGIARGTNPDQELSPRVIKGLSADGLTPQESAPQLLFVDDVTSSQRVITFCDLPAEYPQVPGIEHWDDVPPVSENYEQARDAIIERLHRLIGQMRRIS